VKNLLLLKKKEDYGNALIFDIEKLEKFEDRYSNSYLKGENIKIEVKLKTEEDDETGDFGDFGDFLGVCQNNILNENQLKKQESTTTIIQGNPNNNNNRNRNNNNIHTFQKFAESPESPVDNFLATNHFEKVKEKEKKEEEEE
jgi:hypothetical protein